MLCEGVETPAGDGVYYSDTARIWTQLNEVEKHNTALLHYQINDMFILSVLSGQLVPTPCTVTVACAGYQTGWRPATKNLASPAVLAHRAWRANFCSPHLQRSLNVQVSYCVGHGNILLVALSVMQIILTGLAFPLGDVDTAVQAKCNPCLSSPCLNQGICHSDLTEIYRCSCPPGFKVRTI